MTSTLNSELTAAINFISGCFENEQMPANVRKVVESLRRMESAQSPAAPNEPVQPCTCPSGDGSLRWPCPQHPPEPVQALPALPPAERDESMDRDYLPLPGGWEIQTKGNGSTFRIAHIASGKRWMVLDDNLHKPLTNMALDVRAAIASCRALPAKDEDGARLMFAMQDFDGFVGVTMDKYDYAVQVAAENGREEPTAEDELNGVRRLIDAALAASSKGEGK